MVEVMSKKTQETSVGVPWKPEVVTVCLHPTVNDMTLLVSLDTFSLIESENVSPANIPLLFLSSCVTMTLLSSYHRSKMFP